MGIGGMLGRPCDPRSRRLALRQQYQDAGEPEPSREAGDRYRASLEDHGTLLREPRTWPGALSTRRDLIVGDDAGTVKGPGRTWVEFSFNGPDNGVSVVAIPGDRSRPERDVETADTPSKRIAAR
jgi:hypothetical protein